jgi:hypothetical protein
MLLRHIYHNYNFENYKNIMAANDLHKLRGLTHSFALKLSPKIATAYPRGAPRTVSLMLG